MFGAALCGIMSAQQTRRNNDDRYQKYLAECTQLGVTPKTSHDFMLEIQNAESLQRLSYQKPKIKVSLF